MNWTRIAAVATVSVGLIATPVSAATIKLTQISTTFNTPIGIDYHEPTNTVAMSVNYGSGGNPYNFELVASDGTRTQFSSISGMSDEVKIATVRSVARGGSAQSLAQGFLVGELFTGNGIDGEIVRISPNGSSTFTWSLPGAGNGLMRGSLYVDRTGVYNGDLIVVTTGGEVWRIASSAPANCATGCTKIADVNTHLEGVITVPNDPIKYGSIAGKIIAGAEGPGLMYVFDANGFVGTHNLGVAIEDIDLIQANENFFGVNFGTNKLLGASASDFASMVGDILLTQEFGGGPSGLFRLYWNGTSLVAESIGLSLGSATPGQWEHVTFAPAGILEIPAVPLPASLLLLGGGVAMLAARMRLTGATTKPR